MRKIEFKLWNGKGIIDVKSIDFDDVGNLYHVNGELVNPLEVKILQYTGLKDKNGKEIYEGDIIKRINDSTSSIWKVEFEYAQWKFKPIGEWISYPYASSNAIYMEVIGNIYENPELLKEEEQ